MTLVNALVRICFGTCPGVEIRGTAKLSFVVFMEEIAKIYNSSLLVSGPTDNWPASLCSVCGDSERGECDGTGDGFLLQFVSLSRNRNTINHGKRRFRVCTLCFYLRYAIGA